MAHTRTKDTLRRAEHGSNGSSNEEGEQGGAMAAVADRAANVVKGRLTEKVDKSVEDLDILAKTLQLASEQLKDNVAAPYVGKVADRVRRLSKFIDGTDASDLVRQAQSLGRAQPLLFFGGALALGFAGGRFLRSTGSSATPARQKATDEKTSRSR